jgi:hypothetical protein
MFWRYVCAKRKWCQERKKKGKKSQNSNLNLAQDEGQIIIEINEIIASL